VIALLQRVREAWVRVNDQEVARIGPGLLVLAAVERGDDPTSATRMAERLLTYRVFPDPAGRMNRSLRDTGGELLLVPQFTLAADTRSGTRPGFEPAAPPALATTLFDRLAASCRDSGIATRTGVFGADMDVGLINQGPVTFWLRVPPNTPGTDRLTEE
jgi:D-aminoacyl-tRNA deacylase